MNQSRTKKYEIIEGGFHCNLDGSEDLIQFPCGSGFSLGHWNINEAIAAHRRSHKESRKRCK